jgi:hypothetical protein
VHIKCDRPAEFTIKIRLPWWLQGEATLIINGQIQPMSVSQAGFMCIRRTWADEAVEIELPKGLHAMPLPDASDIVAFLDGPVVMAGLCEGETILQVDQERPESALAPVYELEWYRWRPSYRTQVRPQGIRFKPLYEVQDERYSVYFQLEPRANGES